MESILTSKCGRSVVSDTSFVHLVSCFESDIKYAPVVLEWSRFPKIFPNPVSRTNLLWPSYDCDVVMHPNEAFEHRQLQTLRLRLCRRFQAMGSFSSYAGWFLQIASAGMLTSFVTGLSLVDQNLGIPKVVTGPLNVNALAKRRSQGSTSALRRWNMSLGWSTGRHECVSRLMVSTISLIQINLLCHCSLTVGDSSVGSSFRPATETLKWDAY